MPYRPSIALGVFERIAGRRKGRLRGPYRGLILVVGLSGCQPAPTSPAVPSSGTRPVVRLADDADYSRHVGERIEVTGVVVPDVKLPQVCGILVDELEPHRGRRVRLRGTLREWVVSERGDGLATSLGPGRYYTLADMEYELLP